jgi:ribonuclease BN (tRNA processing enzyme)
MPIDRPAVGASRRGMLRAALTLPVSAAAGIATSGAQAEPVDPLAARDAEVKAALSRAGGATKLVLLGTGAGPTPGRARTMTSSLLVHGKAVYLIDCGLGVTDHFVRTGLRFQDVRSIFITHHHPDHNVEYGPFLMFAWLQTMNPGLRTFGPTTMKQMTDDYLRSMGNTIRYWAEDFGTPPLQHIDAHDIDTAGPVMSDDLVKVSALTVRHPPVTPAFAYRFDFEDRSVVFSGDTSFVPELAEFAKGADVLVHEAMDTRMVTVEVENQIRAGYPVGKERFLKHMYADHTPAEDVGRIAQAAGVKTLVLSHLAPSQGVEDSEWIGLVRRNYAGRVIVGHDQMVV